MDKSERSRLFRMLFFLAVICGIFVFLAPLEAQPVALSYSGSNGYTPGDRTNLRRYVNGKYIGLTSREVRSFISPAAKPGKLSQKAAASFGEIGRAHV